MKHVCNLEQLNGKEKRGYQIQNFTDNKVSSLSFLLRKIILFLMAFIEEPVTFQFRNLQLKH